MNYAEFVVLRFFLFLVLYVCVIGTYLRMWCTSHKKMCGKGVHSHLLVPPYLAVFRHWQ